MKLDRRGFAKTTAAAAALSLAGAPTRLPADSALTYGRSQCRFCGVGCTVLAGVQDGRIVSVKGDADSPINFGRLCMKGYSLGQVPYAEDRLTKPLVRRTNGTYKEVSWDKALEEKLEGR